MLMLIKHKKGSYWPQASAVIRQTLLFYWFKVRFGFSTGFKRWDPEVDVHPVFFGYHSRYYAPGNEQMDWRKLFGSRSGLRTETNLEEIAVYRHVGKLKFEYGRYVRVMNDHFIDGDIMEYSRFEPIAKPVRIRLSYWIPAFSWAGGNPIVNNDNYRVGLSIVYVG